jgi:hypothetical protein
MVEWNSSVRARLAIERKVRAGRALRALLRTGRNTTFGRQCRLAFELRHLSFVIFHASKLPNESEAVKVFTSR